MKSLALLCLLFFIQSCADSKFLDKTKKDQSVLEATEVQSGVFLSENVVMLTQDFVMQGNRPQFFGICTGVIIDDNIVLTAAHCLDHGIKNMKVILNPNPRSALSIETDVFNVIDSEIHDTYAFMKKVNPSLNYTHTLTFDDLKSYDDIALIYLNRKIRNGHNDQVHFLEKITTGTQKFKATVAGFGKTTALKDTSSIDYKLINGVLKQAEINLSSQLLFTKNFSLQQWKKSGVCKGDSGAPVIIEEEHSQKLLAIAIGIFSEENDMNHIYDTENRFDECAGYGVYLNIESLKPWIIKSIALLKKRQTNHNWIFSKN